MNANSDQEPDLQFITIEPREQPNACVIWLHGLGADGHDFEPIVPQLKLNAAHRIRFIFPHAPMQAVTINGGMEMRAWYDISAAALDRQVDEAGIRRSAAAVARILAQQITAGIESSRIVLAGFSQGGAITLHLGLRYPQRLAGLLVLSSYLALPDKLTAEAEAMQNALPIFMAHGSADPLVPEAHGNRSAQFLKQAGYRVDYHTYPMQHAVCAAEIDAVGAWLKTRLADA